MNSRAVVYVTNEGNKNKQNLDFSKTTDAKEVHLYGGTQNLTFNDSDGNVAIVDTGADGNKNISFGNGTGDLAIVDSDSESGFVNIADGKGNDTVVVRGAMQTTFNMGEGNDVLIVTDNAGGNVTLAGYNCEEDVISIQEPIKSIADAVANQTIQFTDGGKVKIVGTNAATEIDIDDGDSSDGRLVRLADTDGNKSLAGFTAESGGLVGDASLEESILLVGNIDGKKLGGSSLQGGTRNDTVYAGEFDSVSAGAGRDFVSLKSGREFGAAINISEGITSIENMNNTFGEEGDVLYIDNLNMNSISFVLENGNLVISESNGFKATIVDADTVKGGFVRQLIRTGNNTYRFAVGQRDGTIYVDDDYTPNVFIGNGAKVDFTNFTGEALVDLGGDWMKSSIGSDAAYFKGVNNITAGSGNDTIFGSNGNDSLNGGKGKDILYGGTGHNSLNGGSGNDTLFGSHGNDTLVGGSGKDKLFGEAGKDTISGGAGNDSLNGGTGNDTLTGGKGNDLFIYSAGKDVITDYASGDKISLGAAISKTTFTDSDAVFTIGKGSLTVRNAKGKNLSVIVNDTERTIIGGAQLLDNSTAKNVTLGANVEVADATARTKAVKIVGNKFNNKLYGGSKNDSLFGGKGNDTLTGGKGNDLFIYSAGKDVITDYAKGDKISLGAAISKTTFTDSDAVFTIGKGTLTIKDGKGVKLSMIDSAGKSFTTIVGGGVENLKLKNSAATPVTVEAATKTIDATARTKAVKITGNVLANTILGGSGNDSLYGGKGNDSILGGAGNDKLYGQAGNDILRGGTGNDTLSGGKGDDSLWGGSGKDTFIYSSGSGKDVIYSFGDDDLLKITGTFSATYSKSKDEVYFKVGTTSKAITLSDFTATSFHVNGTSYRISGSKLVK